MYFFITAIAENPASHIYEVSNGIKIRKALLPSSDFSSFTSIQKLISSMLPNVLFNLLSQDSSTGFSSSTEVESDDALVLNGS